MKMRQILSKLMSDNNDDAYSLEEKSGVPQPTTHRFLSGEHGDPRSTTVRKWAAAYGISESQLRGDVPLSPTQGAIQFSTAKDQRSRQLVQDLCDLAEQIDDDGLRGLIEVATCFKKTHPLVKKPAAAKGKAA